MKKYTLPPLSESDSLAEYIEKIFPHIQENVQIGEDERKYEKTYQVVACQGYSGIGNIKQVDFHCFVHQTVNGVVEPHRTYALFTLIANGIIRIQGKSIGLVRERSQLCSYYERLGTFFRCPLVFETQESFIIGVHNRTHQRMILRGHWAYRPYSIATKGAEMYANSVTLWQREKVVLAQNARDAALAIPASVQPDYDIERIGEVAGVYDPDRHITDMDFLEIV